MEYIKEYTRLNTREKKQLFFKRLFKKQHPEWDDTLILITKLFAKYLPAHKICLFDFGCGHGNWVVDELREHIAYSVGLDVDLSATTNNTSMNEIVLGDLNHPRLQQEKFDAVTALWVFEHVSDPDKIFPEIYRVLKLGGIFAFVTPNQHNFLIIIRRFFNRIACSFGTKLVARIYGRSEKDIYHTFYKANDVATIRQLAYKAGFSIRTLITNFDPSYTSFNRLSYFPTKLLYKTNSTFFHPHLIVILQKR